MALSQDETKEKTVYVSRERKLEKLTRDGFGNRFLDNVDDFECPICVLVTRDTLQISACGHRFCSTCWQDWTRSSPTPTCCPIDGEEVDPNWVFPDRNADRKIRGLKVFCGNQELGCDATPEFRDLEVHESKCQYQTVACELGCGERVFVWAVDEHLQHDYPRRWVACEACGEQLMAGDAQAHTETCPMKVVSCEFCHVEGLLNKDLVAHKDRDCPSFPTHCSFGMLGCTDKVMRSELPAHHQVRALQHLALINSALSSAYEGEVAGVIQGPRYELPAPLWGRVGNVVKLATNQQITETDVKLTNEIDTLKQRNVELTNEIANIEQTHNLKIQELEDANHQVMKLCEDMGEKIEKLEKGMKDEKSGSEGKGGGEVQVGAYGGGSGVVQAVGGVGVSGGSAGAGGVGRGGGVGQSMEITAGMRVTCPCYWRVKVTRNMDVYSPPFYTQDGYKMCLRVVCYGSLLDVNCYLMAGERDGELRWPWAGEERMTVREVGSGRELVGEWCGVVKVGHPGRYRPQGGRNGGCLFYNYAITHPGQGVIEITIT